MHKKHDKKNEMDFIAFSSVEMLKRGIIKDIHQLTRNMPPVMRQDFYDSLKHYMSFAEGT